jgi:hypothetical protein
VHGSDGVVFDHTQLSFTDGTEYVLRWLFPRGSTISVLVGTDNAAVEDLCSDNTCRGCCHCMVGILRTSWSPFNVTQINLCSNCSFPAYYPTNDGWPSRHCRRATRRAAQIFCSSWRLEHLLGDAIRGASKLLTGQGLVRFKQAISQPAAAL